MSDIDEPKKTAAKDKSEESFDIVGLLLDFLGHWQWFVLSIVLCLGIAWYYNKTIIPIYNVTASVYLQSDEAQSKRNLIGANTNFEGERWIDETEIEKIKSRNNMVRIVDSLNLSYNYYTRNTFRDVPIYRTNAVVAEMDSVSLYNLEGSLVFTIEPDGDKYILTSMASNDGLEDDKVIELDSLPTTVHTVKGAVNFRASLAQPKLEHWEKIVIRNPRDVAGSLSGSVDIQYAENSEQILRITYRTPLIEQGKDIINTLIAFYNQDIIEDKNRAAVQTEKFILDRLAVVSAELKNIEERLQQHRETTGSYEISAEVGAAQGTKQQTESQIAQLRSQQSLLDMQLDAIKKTGVYEPLPVASPDPAVNAIIDTYNKSAADFERLSGAYGEDHPERANYRDKAATLRSQIIDKINAQRNALQGQINAIAPILSQSSTTTQNAAKIDKKAEEINRDMMVMVNIYTFLLQKREEIALEKAMTTPTARLIDDPAGSGPIQPNTMMIYVVALLIGIGIPALFFLLRRLLFPVFKDQDDLERLTSVPILGEIYRTGKNAGNIVVGENVSTNIAELFRLVRNNLQFALGDPRKKVVMCTSAIAGEGKTFITINTALTFALTGKRVIIIGMDIRRPALAPRFGLTNDIGLTNYLSGQTTNPQDIIFSSGLNDNLDVIPAGPIPPNPNELLMSPNMDKLLNRLREEYDYIFIDSAPIGLISDTFLIAPHSDVQIFVVRANYSTRRCVRFMHKAISSGRFANCYIVLNAVNSRASSYAYRRYGYYTSERMGSYGYSHHRNDKPTPWRRFKRLLRRANRKTRG